MMDGISQYLDERSIRKIARCYADKGYNAEFIREYLTKRKISDCIPYRKNSNMRWLPVSATQSLYLLAATLCGPLNLIGMILCCILIIMYFVFQFFNKFIRYEYTNAE